MALFLLNAVEEGLLKHIGDFYMKKEPDHVLDIAGTVIPLALLKVSALFKEMRVHEREIGGFDRGDGRED